MIQAIQVLRFHLLELEKVSRKWHSRLWYRLPSPSWVGRFLTCSLRNWTPGDFEQHVSSPFKLLLNPGTQDSPVFKSSLPPFSLRHSGLFWNAANHLCYWTFSLLVSLLAPLTLRPKGALGASTGNHPHWGVFTLLCSSIAFPWKHANLLAYWMANANAPSSSVLTFWCYH